MRIRHMVVFNFDSQSDYDAYNKHPDHLAFVEECWKTQVSGFMEINFSY